MLIERKGGPWTNPIWEQIRDRPQLFDGAVAWSRAELNLKSGNQPEFISGIFASGRFFDVLGVPAILGRTFNEADDQRGGGRDGPVAVLSYRFWQGQFGGSSDVIGRTLRLDRIPLTIVGVTPPGFFGLEAGGSFDVIVPIGTEPLIRGQDSWHDGRTAWWLNILVRRKPDQTEEAATVALRAVQPQIREMTLPGNPAERYVQDYLKEPFTLRSAAREPSWWRSRYERPLCILMAVSGLVLLIACTNIANLLLARTAARRHELSVRRALGASRLRLARQLVVESLLLSCGGAVLGLSCAKLCGQWLVQQLSVMAGGLSLYLPLDWRLLGFSAVVTGVATLLFGTIPALRASRTQPNEVLKEEGYCLSSNRRFELGSALVVVQMALSLVLVFVAGLFIRTFLALVTLDPGFDQDRVLIVNIGSQGRSTKTVEVDRLSRAVAGVPGVAQVAASTQEPVNGINVMTILEAVPGEPGLTEADLRVNFNSVSPGWFTTYGTSIIAGRDFAGSDRLDEPSVAIVNEAFARKFFSGIIPVGRTIVPYKKPVQIIGLVKDAVYASLREPAPPTIYFPLRPNPRLSIKIGVRMASGLPRSHVRDIAAAIDRAYPDLTVSFRPLADIMDASLAQERLIAMLSGFFGFLALLLAGLGVYGVTAYAVIRRRFEIGIRMTLGATPARVVGMMLGRVGMLIGAGVALGTVLNLWSAHIVGSLLFGLRPTDPITLAAAVAVLVLVGAVAGLLPARRAARINPTHLLRNE